MTDPTMHQVLTELAALRAEVRQQRRAARRAGIARRFAPTAAVTLLLALAPLALLAASPFTDLDPASPHNEDIGLIYDAGITTGCSAVAFCSNNLLTRQEMASFLARTAGLGDHPPVVNAARAMQASNADQLGGQPARAYLLNGASPTFTDIRVIGDLTHEYAPGTVRSLAPLAYGTVFASGSGAIGTGNFTVEYNTSLARYEIDFFGVEYEIDTHLTVATPFNSGQQIGATGGPGGKLIVTLTDTAGYLVQGQFQFITYAATAP